MSTKVCNIINFHGVTLWVVEHEGVEYIQAKKLTDLAGLVWRSAKNTLFEPDNQQLFETVELKDPIFEGNLHNIVQEKSSIYMRLDMSRMYLAQINTAKMRAKGKTAEADALLKLKKEWAKVLTDYETHGIAIKGSKTTSIDVIAKIDRIKNPGLKRLAAEEASREYGLDISIPEEPTLFD